MNRETVEYTLFTRPERCYIVFLVSFGGWFSTLSSFIYYPAIAAIAHDLEVSISKINLTVTSYMVMSTIAPAFVGDAADILGRRTLYIITIGLYVASNAALAKARSFPALLGLRMLQSATISGTVSLKPCKYPTDRDRDFLDRLRRHSRYSLACRTWVLCRCPIFWVGRSLQLTDHKLIDDRITTAPSIGPVLGGALAFTAGWRWIFWFLCIASGCCFAMMVSTLPETARNLVGNGSVAPPLGARLPFKRFMNHWNVPSHCDGRRFPNPLESLWILYYKDNLILIVGGSILYMVYCCIHASLATQFIDFYGLNQWQAGLIYLPFGAGCTLSTVFSGKLIDKGYKSIALLYGLPLDRTTRGGRELFPFEKARLRCIWIPITTATVSVSGFGWVLDKRTVKSVLTWPARAVLTFRQHISIPLVFQFIAGVSIQTCFNVGRATRPNDVAVLPVRFTTLCSSISTTASQLRLRLRTTLCVAHLPHLW